MQPKCKNCVGAQIAPKCRDSKRHECGKVLKSPEERLQYWYDTHRQGHRARSTSPNGTRGTNEIFPPGKDGNSLKLRWKQSSNKRSRDESRSDYRDYGSSEDSEDDCTDTWLIRTVIDDGTPTIIRTRINKSVYIIVNNVNNSLVQTDPTTFGGGGNSLTEGYADKKLRLCINELGREMRRINNAATTAR